MAQYVLVRGSSFGGALGGCRGLCGSSTAQLRRRGRSGSSSSGSRCLRRRLRRGYLQESLYPDEALWQRRRRLRLPPRLCIPLLQLRPLHRLSHHAPRQQSPAYLRPQQARGHSVLLRPMRAVAGLGTEPSGWARPGRRRSGGPGICFKCAYLF